MVSVEPLLMKPGLPTVYNCPQFTKQSVAVGDRFFEQMRVISTTITKQISSFKRYSDIKASFSRVNEVLFSVEATCWYCALVQSLTNLHVMSWPLSAARQRLRD